MTAMRIVKFRGTNRDWYWRLKADNGESIAIGGEGYRDERDCNRAINLVKTHMPISSVYQEGPFGETLDSTFSANALSQGLLGGLR